MSRKPRSDSKLDALPEPQFMELRDGLLDGSKGSYEECLSWLATECGVHSTLSALSSFYRRHCKPLVAERRQYAAMRAEALGEAMEADPVDWDAAIIERTKQLTFEFLDSGKPEPEDMRRLLDGILKARSQTVDERKVALMEAKAKQAEEAEKVTGDAALSAEEKQARLKSIFGMG